MAYWEQRLEQLVKACNRRGASVKFEKGAEDEYCVQTKVITINNRRTPEYQCYILLHELGHHVICKTRCYKTKYAVLNLARSVRTLSKKILVLEEEVTAWHLGEKLAKTYDIRLGEKYQVLKSRCLKSHAVALSLT